MSAFTTGVDTQGPGTYILMRDKTFAITEPAHGNDDMTWKLLHVIGPLCGESIGDRWILLTKNQQHGTNTVFHFTYPWTNGWTNRGVAGDLRRHVVYVMSLLCGL